MKVFCQICRLKSERDEMISVEKKTAKTTAKKYYHSGECHEAYLEEEKTREKEVQDWDTLCKLILTIHGKQQMPTSFPAYLQDLRNGTIRFIKGGKVMEKRKEGIPFDVIIEAYQIAENDIKKAIRMKSFEKDRQEFNYALKIATNKINAVHLRRKRKTRLEGMVDKPVISIGNEFIYKPTAEKTKNDISDFLDD